MCSISIYCNALTKIVMDNDELAMLELCKQLYRQGRKKNNYTNLCTRTILITKPMSSKRVTARTVEKSVLFLLSETG